VGKRSWRAVGTAVLASVLALMVVAPAMALPSRERGAWKLPVADGPPPTSAPDASRSHHGPSAGHLPPRQQELDLVGRLEPKGQFGPVVPGQIADLAVHKGFAYLNSWDNPDCQRGGTYVVDIRDPSQPKEVGFIPAPPDFYHGEGAHAVSLDVPGFRGDVLAVNDETYGSNLTAPCSPADKSFGGFDLYDVSNPANPVPLVQGAGDRDVDNDPSTPLRARANSYHSVFVWQDGPRAFLVASDNVELTDVDIFDITDPRNPQQVADLDIAADFPQVLEGEEANGGLVLHHDVVVKRIGGRPVMKVDYWDAGYVQLDVSDPSNPTLITDTRFAGEDPLFPGSGLTPEGNAHQGEFSFDNQFLLAADEDFTTFRLTSTITEAPFEGVEFTPAVSDAEPIPGGSVISGDTEFVGDACDTLPAPTAGVTIALAERGGTLPGGEACGFQNKIDNIEAAGYELAIIFNNTAGEPPRCESLINMLVDPATTDIPALFVGRAEALQILGVFDESTYQCTGAATPTPGDTEAPPVGTQGLSISLASNFDGWGYAHLYDAQTSAHLDAFAIPEALDARFADGFGDLSIHEFATDPTTNLAYASYYAGGIRVLRFSRQNGLEQVGAWISDDVDGQGPGSNFWGVEQFTTPQGERLIAGSDRDYGLVILRYTGPGAPTPPAPPANPTPPPSGGAPSNRVRLRLGRYRNGRLIVRVRVDSPGRLRAGLRANLPRVGAARVVRLARTSRRVTRAGTVRLTLRLSRAKRRQLGRALRSKGRLRGRVTVVWTPTGGNTRRVSRGVVIRR
jgi:hypothetical protein